MLYILDLFSADIILFDATTNCTNFFKHVSTFHINANSSFFLSFFLLASFLLQTNCFYFVVSTLFACCLEKRVRDKILMLLLCLCNCYDDLLPTTTVLDTSNGHFNGCLCYIRSFWSFWSFFI